MRRFHLLLTGLSLVIVALSANRLTGFTETRLAPHEFLRWLDFNAMIPIPIAGVVLFLLLKRDVERAGSARPTRALVALDVAFVAGVFLLGVSSGDHETTNYLHHRFCAGQSERDALCDVVVFHDDTFSHVVYYVGVISYTLAVVTVEWLFPRRDEATRRDQMLVLLNAAVIALGVFANLAFEEAALDMVAFAVVAGVANGLLWLTGRRRGQLPFTLYTAASFGVGVVAAALYKVVA